MSGKDRADRLLDELVQEAKRVQGAPEDVEREMRASLAFIKRGLSSHPSHQAPARYLVSPLQLLRRPAAWALAAAVVVAIVSIFVFVPPGHALARSREAMLNARTLVCHAQISHAPDENLVWTMCWSAPSTFRIDYKSNDGAVNTVHWIKEGRCVTLVTDEDGRHIYSSKVLPFELNFVWDEMSDFVENGFLMNLMDGRWETRTRYREKAGSRTLFQREHNQSTFFLQTAVDDEQSLPVFYHLVKRPRRRAGAADAFPVLFSATFEMTWARPIGGAMIPDRGDIPVEIGNAMAWGQGNQLRKIRRSLGYLKKTLGQTEPE